MRSSLLVMERVVGLTGQDVGFAAPVAFIGEQVPGALGLDSLLRRQNSRKSRSGSAAPAWSAR